MSRSLRDQIPPDAELAVRAVEINRLFDVMGVGERNVTIARTMVGRQLLVAKEQVRSAGLKWEQWCEANIKRSMRDIQKVMKIAAAPDPQGAHETEKAVGREREATVRTQAKQAAHVPPFAQPQQPVRPHLRVVEPIDDQEADDDTPVRSKHQVLADWLQLSPDDRAWVKQRITTYTGVKLDATGSL